jgi:hypothetical protein
MVMTRPRRIEVHIDELVLNAVDRSLGQGVAEAVQSALAALLAGGGLSPVLEEGATVDRMEGHAILGEPGEKGFGDAIARSVFEGLNRWGR